MSDKFEGTRLRVYFLFQGSDNHRELHSFPTRRSSDLITPESGCKKGSVMNWKDGIFTRAVLYDIAQLKGDRKSTRLNSSHVSISYAVFCLKKKKNKLDNANENMTSTSAQTMHKSERTA